MVPSRRAIGRVLFVASLIALPLPWYLGELERAPWLRLAFFTGLYGGVLATEGGGGTTRLFALGMAQVVLYGAALRLAAALVARALAGVRAPAWRAAAVAGIATALIGAGFLPIYDTPLSSRRPHSSLLGIFD